MGGAKERCLKCESAGDERVGRVACGLDQLSTDFAVSSPYFDFKHMTDTIESIEMQRKIESWLKSQLTDLDSITAETFSLIHATFASLCY